MEQDDTERKRDASPPGMSPGAPPSTPGARLRALRGARCLSTEQAGAAVGISQSHMSRIELGGSTRIEVIDKLCRFYGVSLDYVIRGTPRTVPDAAAVEITQIRKVG